MCRGYITTEAKGLMLDLRPSLDEDLSSPLWLEAAVRGGVEQLPIVNLSPLHEGTMPHGITNG